MALDLCTVRTAEHPFLIGSVGIRIYSIEELCFFLYRNVCLIDESIVGEMLVDWLRDELGLTRLCRRLRDALDRPDRDDSYFVLAIFGEIGYLTLDEQRRVKSELIKNQLLTEDEREKLRADYLVSCARYKAAERSYRRILKRTQPGSAKAIFCANVWNNLGCAYAMEFRFEKASECFLEGWKLTHSRELMRKYVSALPLFLSGEEYSAKLKSLGADPVLITRIQEWNVERVKSSEEKIRARLSPADDPRAEIAALEEEYRRGEGL
jgi:tetratricopeptide (TPR) repeat protein